jgi:hypothetical protein
MCPIIKNKSSFGCLALCYSFFQTFQILLDKLRIWMIWSEALLKYCQAASLIFRRLAQQLHFRAPRPAT